MVAAAFRFFTVSLILPSSASGPQLPMADIASKTAILFNADMVRQATVTTNTGFPIARHDSETALGTDC